LCFIAVQKIYIKKAFKIELIKFPQNERFYLNEKCSKDFNWQMDIQAVQNIPNNTLVG